MAEPLRLVNPESLPHPSVRQQTAGIPIDLTRVSDAEILAALVGPSGNAARLQEALIGVDGLIGLMGMTPVERRNVLCLNPRASRRLEIGLEWFWRCAQARRAPRRSLSTPEAVTAWMGQTLGALQHEEFWCLPLDVHSRVIGRGVRTSQGSVDSTDVCQRTFYRAALAAGASSAIAVHNHPSGDPRPSAADMAVTRRLVAVGRQLGLPCVDHVIVCAGGTFVSLRRDHPEVFA